MKISAKQLNEMIKQEINEARKESSGPMTVEQLISALNRLPEKAKAMEVLSGDHDGYWYSIYRVSTRCIKDGEESSGRPNCVTLEPT